MAVLQQRHEIDNFFVGHWQAYTLASCQLSLVWCCPHNSTLQLTECCSMWHAVGYCPSDCTIFTCHMEQSPSIAFHQFLLSVAFHFWATSHFVSELCMEVRSFTFCLKIAPQVALVAGDISVNFNFPFIANWRPLCPESRGRWRNDEVLSHMVDEGMMRSAGWFSVSGVSAEFPSVL